MRRLLTVSLLAFTVIAEARAGSSSSYSSSRSYSSPSRSYSSPSRSFSVPSRSFSVPSRSYNSFSSPSRSYSIPNRSYNRPPPIVNNYHYVAPSRVYIRREIPVYRSYYSRPVVHTYHDNFNPYFWMWLMDHKENQAQWVYNHRNEMDNARYQELLAKNSQLESEVRALEVKGVAKDPAYVPQGIDKQTMYEDPTPIPTPVPTIAPVIPEEKDTGFPWGWCLFGFGTGTIVILGVRHYKNRR
jgi:hypothetical protein